MGAWKTESIMIRLAKKSKNDWGKKYTENSRLCYRPMVANAALGTGARATTALLNGKGNEGPSSGTAAVLQPSHHPVQSSSMVANAALGTGASTVF